MQRETELALISELLDLDASQTAYLDETVTTSDVAHYLDEAHFQREMQAVFRAHPQIVIHSSELPEPGSFMRREIASLPGLLTRDKDGEIHAFLNVCRHRGARLVEEKSGCKHLFSCPYHAWTFTNSGQLRGIPHGRQGFPDIDKTKMGLKRLPAWERFGWIWVLPQVDGEFDFDGFVEEIAPDLAWLNMENMRVAQSDEITSNTNWKILVEGGIEAYHFKVAHADTIGPYFQDNLSSYRMFGQHMRSVLPRATMPDLRDVPKDQWDIRKHTNLLYTVFPANQLLVQQDHIAWINLEPLSAGRSKLRISTVVPADAGPDLDTHWAQNQKITRITLAEDFAIGEGIQAGLASGANTHLTFGRYEGALDSFAQTVEQALAKS